MQIHAVILAAGGSTRLGSPKQLLAHEGESLLRRSVQTAISSRAAAVTVVLGCDEQRMREELAGITGITIALNADWREGMASSIRTGIASLPPGADGAIIMLVDQPRVSSRILDDLMELHTTAGSDIAACRYDNGPGVPALFPASFFTELLSLNGDRGARGVIRAHPGRVSLIDFPDGAIDIDTPEQMHFLRPLH